MSTRLSRKLFVSGFLSLFLLIMGVAISLLVPIVSSSAVNNSLTEYILQTPTDSVLRVSIPTNDIVYNPADKLLYASVPSKAGNIGNSLIQINPKTGTTGTSTYIGSEPNRLALAADNQTMYVALDGAYAVQQFNTSTQTLGSQFSSGTDSTYPYQINDLIVAPNNPNLVAIARSSLQSTRNIAVYKDGVECPQTTPWIQFNSLAFSDSGAKLFGAYGSQLTSMSVNSDGRVDIIGTTALSVSPSMIKIDNGLIFTSGGQVINTDTGTVKGMFPGVYSHTFMGDTAVGRAYYIVNDNESGNLKINAYDINTFNLVGSLIIPNSTGAPRYIERWGANGLALSTWDNQLYLIQTSLVPSSEPIQTPSPTPTVTPSPSITPYAAFTRELSLPVNDLIYNNATQKLYVSVPSRAGGSVGNTVTAIDPKTGTIDNSIQAGSEPGKISLSDDSRTMYVGLDGAGSIRKIDLTSQTAGLLFTLGTSSNGAYAPIDIAVKPGAPGTVAVLRAYNELVIYEEGIQKAVTTNSEGLKTVFFGSSDTVYSNTLSRILKYSITEGGLSIVKSLPGSSDGDLYLENGKIYLPSGMVVDAETGLIKGTYSGLGAQTAMAIDTPNNRAFFLTNRMDYSNGYAIRAYELDTFRFVGSVNVQGSFYGSGAPILVRWGSNGFAYRDNNEKLFVVQTSLVNSAVAVPTPTPTITPTTSPSSPYIPTFVRKIELPVRDIVYNESMQSIYASVPSTAGEGRGNSITQISPSSGTIGSSVFVGSEPNKLALADDGRTLYTKLDGANAIRRFDVVTQTAGVQFTPAVGFQNPRDMAVLPGSPGSVALAGGPEGVAIYDNGVQRARTGKNAMYSIEGLGFSPNSPILYGHGRLYSNHDLVKFAIDSSGVTAVNTTYGMFPGHDIDIKLSAGLLFSTTGRVVEPETPRLLGTFNEGGTSMAVDPALERVFFITNSVLSAYDINTFLKIGSIILPSNIGSAGRKSLLRWGTNGLAVLVGSSSSNSNVKQLYLIQSELVSASVPVPTGLQVKAADNIFESSQNATVTVTRTGNIATATTVNYATSDLSAKANSDYIPTVGTITFAAGETSKNILVPLVNDNVYEEQETFALNLSNPIGSEVQLLSSNAVVTINNEDPKPILSASNVIVQEPISGTVEAIITVRLSNPTSQIVTVNYITNNGTATSGNDYIATSGTLTFNPLETVKTITVGINADGVNEDNETFVLSFSNATNTANTTGQALITIRNTPAMRQSYDFDGDGKSDVSVYRPSNGSWYLNQSQNGFTGIQFGLSTDVIVPADYDGDGKTDIAVFRLGTWYLQRSQAGFTGVSFGASDDIPVPADYDGDGKADVAIFRPSTGVWYLLRSTLGFTGVTFGQTGDKPVAADYDGDGKADIAVYRSGTWYLQRSQLGFTGIAFGENTDKPVAADYDGDGKADIAVFRPSNGTWYLQRSTAGFTGVQFGLATDLPVPADYDGDGKTDVSVFRDGNWYLQRSTQGFTGISFGALTDKPVPNAFIP